MTLATLSMASDSVRAACVWPTRTVATAATRLLEDEGVIPNAYTLGRAPEHVATAVHSVATDSTYNAVALLDDEIVSAPCANVHSAPVDAFVHADAALYDKFTH